VLGKILLEIEKSKAKDPKKPMPQTGAPNSEGAAVATDAPEAEEIIPPIDEFRKHLDYSTRAEEVAISIRNSYPGQAFAGGVIFDFVAGFLQNRDFGGVSDSRLKNAQNYLAEIFSDGIRCGVAANEIMQKISISHQKNAFVTALVHNIGKALLFTYDPKAFERAFVESTGAKDAKNRVDSAEAESIEFEFDHAQIGSLYLGRLPFLEEIERSVDYHHNPHLLKFANPKLYALACVLRVSGALAKLYQSQRSEDPDVEQLKDQKLVLSKDFQFLQLNQIDWLDIKSNYALKLMKIGY
jgi:HD-like signal output (HDOD) protein